MNRSIHLLVAVTVCAFCVSVESTSQTRVDPQKIFTTAFSLRKLEPKTNQNACQGDMEWLDKNQELKDSMENVTNAFSETINQNINQYCTGRKEGVTTFMDCNVDYNKFSEGYLNLCSHFGGKFYPVKLLMKCEGEQVSRKLDIKMEVSNIPVCLGKTCDVGEIYSALLEVFKRTEDSITDADLGLDCEFYHDYLHLLDAPNTITIPVEEEEEKEQTVSSSSDRSTFAAFLSIGLVGVFIALS